MISSSAELSRLLLVDQSLSGRRLGKAGDTDNGRLADALDRVLSKAGSSSAMGRPVLVSDSSVFQISAEF